MQQYKPPKQGKIGQIVDSLFILLLLYAALMMPLLLSSDEGGVAQNTHEASTEKVALTWESLGQNKTMQAQWEGLGVSIEDAEKIINDKFDYTIEPISLTLTALIIFGYFFLLFKFSRKEYEDVIAEKFGSKK